MGSYVTKERRDTTRRAELVRWIAQEIVQNADIQVTAELVAQWVHVPITAANRIIQHLVDAGLLKPLGGGVWVRARD
jgi:hypothetical protein